MKVICVTLFYCLCILLAQPIYGMDISGKQDSVKKLLDQSTKVERRLELLQQLSALNLDDTQAESWLKQLRNEASSAQQHDKEGWAIRNLTRYYYNTENLDSLKHYVHQMDTLVSQSGVYSDHYYDVYTFFCQYLLWEGELEQSADLAIRLYNLAKEQNNENGIICNCETMGLINQRINRDSIAVSFFKEGIELLDRQPEKYRFTIQFLTNIIESELKLNQYHEARTYLNKFEQKLQDVKAGVFGEDLSFPYDRCYMLLYCYFGNLYLQECNASKAKEYLDKANTYRPLVNDPYVDFYYLYNLATYYRLTKQYQSALAYADTVLKLDPQNPEVWKLRGSILFNMGNMRGAALQYLDALLNNEKMNSESFTRQLSVLHTLHDMNKLELQVKELRLKELVLDAKQQQLRWTYSLIILLSLFLLVGTKLYLHTRKLKNELQEDKLALQQSEKDLRIARNQAEESDRLKSMFLSNMSHEIRTPLNAIVGFSQVLEAEMDDDDERKIYTHVITNNSELLLNLVNDILDISRLESERYRFTFEPQNLAECCQNALTSVKHKVKPGVELRFTPEDSSFILLTDKLRLQQVLINLINNAAKFTEKGWIELSYRINREEEIVYFTVTDTGCGIPPEKQDAIFERFEKLHEHIQGTGLGLSICKIISSRFDGDIILDKDYREGARFIFTHAFSNPSQASSNKSKTSSNPSAPL